MKLGNLIVKNRTIILIVTIILLIPALIGFKYTKINYDLLNYLPDSFDTVAGQKKLIEEFGKGDVSYLIVENMNDKDLKNLKDDIEKLDNIESVISYTSLFDDSIPKELLPDSIYSEFNKDNSTLMMVFFSSDTSDNNTLDTVNAIRNLARKQCFLSGMSSLITDMKNIFESQELVYGIIGTVLVLLAMMLFLDNFIIPIVFLVSIGIMILFNLGSNIFIGKISFITKSLSAVLQLAVTMDYSIFLWHSYKDYRKSEEKLSAMKKAIADTITSILGSSTTTIAGFIALCFMTFMIGMDLGIVLAKGVIIGVLGCLTTLPAIILLLDSVLQKTMHRPIIGSCKKISNTILKLFPIFLIIFIVTVYPSFNGYLKAHDEVYYDMVNALPKDMDYAISNSKLKEKYNIATSLILLSDSHMKANDVNNMMDEINATDGVKNTLGLDSILGGLIPREMLPDSVTKMLRSENLNLTLINSSYSVGSDNVHKQIDRINSIIKKYDSKSMLIGEAPTMKDLTETTKTDLKKISAISILAIFIIILLVEKSISLPFILIAVIEFAIFINIGISHYIGQSLPFFAPICISTIQLGATVDYAILMTTKYKRFRNEGLDKKEAIKESLSTSIPSIVVSAMSLVAATLGVAIYSDIDIISSICLLMSRGAVISLLSVILFLPSLLMIFDKIVIATTLDMRKNKKGEK